MVSKAIRTSRYTAIVSLTNTGKVVIKHTSLIITVSNNNLVTINNRAYGNVIRRSLKELILLDSINRSSTLICCCCTSERQRHTHSRYGT